MQFVHVVGARPNFMKVAPVMAALAKRPHWRQTLVHTGQHYDDNMSKVFFDELEIPKPDVNLDVGSGTHAVQTAQIMVQFEQLMLHNRPDWVVVYGDVNSTLAATLVCAKLRIPIAHVEAGLRSFDPDMPEEVNRLVTDRLADLLLTPSIDGNEHLIAEGVPRTKIHFVGNVMIDTMWRLKPKSDARWPILAKQHTLKPQDFILVTLHRPSNVDDTVYLPKLMKALDTLAQKIPVVFPVHPRTRSKMEQMGIAPTYLKLIQPMGYLDFLALQTHAKFVVTDSGGVQEETTCLGVPCLTMRENTERPITVSEGTNTLIGRDLEVLQNQGKAILEGIYKIGKTPLLWEGGAGERIAQTFESLPRYD